jgi:phosphate transport system protein
MPRQNYQSQLEELRADILYMSELVLDRLQDALVALEAKDDAQAQSVIEGDQEVNQRYLELEQDCIDLIALQQPVASDLRFIAASFKIITDLERVGDLAVNLAEYTQNAGRDVFPEVDIQVIGDLTVEMIEDAMRAYATEDTGTCRGIAARDDDLDDLCQDASEMVVRDLIETELEDGANVETLMSDVSRLLLTIRDLERVGDHAVNIAARTLYMVENDDELIY